VASLVVVAAISHSSTVRADVLGFAAVTFFVSSILGVISPEHSAGARKRNDSIDPFDRSASKRNDHSFDPLHPEADSDSDQKRVM
ncbi:MAG: hypothetical protein K2X81_09120, partial [Candidatus Obscuribacterales bacterium]|nr:hypothetical protein [Candidatus Obscuribacterales bacterium]